MCTCARIYLSFEGIDSSLDSNCYLHEHMGCIFTYYKPLCRGDFLTIQKGNVCASSWMDRKIVTVMSTTSQPDVGSALRRQKDGSRISVPRPLSIMEYNFMGGIDRGDRVRGYSISTFFTLCWTSPSLMHTSSRRATTAVLHSKPSKSSDCSWQVS